MKLEHTKSAKSPTRRCLIRGAVSEHFVPVQGLRNHGGSNLMEGTSRRQVNGGLEIITNMGGLQGSLTNWVNKG